VSAKKGRKAKAAEPDAAQTEAPAPFVRTPAAGETFFADAAPAADPVAG
jgi:hypothetical protein